MPRQSVRITAQQESHLKGTKHIGCAELDLHYQTSELMCRRATKGNTEKKKYLWIKKRMNKSDSLWVRQTLKNVLFPRRRRRERLDCTDSPNMSKMKHWRFVEIRIPASRCDSRREERSASGFDPALQIQPRILGWTLFFRCLKRTWSYQRCSAVIRFLFFRCSFPW